MFLRSIRWLTGAMSSRWCLSCGRTPVPPHRWIRPAS